MKGSEFAAHYGPKGLPAWEAAALACVRASDSWIPWPMVPLTIQAKNHTIILRVTSDVFTVGEPGDYLRLPLLPCAAQTIANHLGCLLPTPKIVYEMFKQASVKLEPIEAPHLPAPYNVNLPAAPLPPPSGIGTAMNQWLLHSQAVDQAYARAGVTPGSALASGLKKDIIVGALMKPKVVVIYGWFHADNRPYKEILPVTPEQQKIAQPLQPRSNVHGDFYVDYSHGVHLVDGTCTVDGVTMKTEDVYRSPDLCDLVSDEGPIRVPRYPSANDPAPVVYPAGIPTKPPLATYGADLIMEWAQRSRGGTS